MKRLSSPLLLILLSMTACASKEEKGYYKNGAIAYRVTLNEKGNYEGIYTQFYETGNKKAELPFSKNHVNGIVKKYDLSGQLLSTAIYKDGESAGEVLSFYPTGEVRSRGTIYGKIPRGPMRYYYRNGKVQHLRIYDTLGKIVDFAEFKSSGRIDQRYTQPLVYIENDTVSAEKVNELEIVLAGQASEDVWVKFKDPKLILDSLPGVYSKYKYKLKFSSPGRMCISGNIIQREHYGDTIKLTSFPWRQCFYVEKHVR